MGDGQGAKELGCLHSTAPLYCYILAEAGLYRLRKTIDCNTFPVPGATRTARIVREYSITRTRGDNLRCGVKSPGTSSRTGCKVDHSTKGELRHL